ncbi:MAG: bifunctional nuclease family protein [Candidatus Baldrarchaeia archaeon]
MSEKFVEVKIFEVVSLVTPFGPVPALLLEDNQERILPVIIGREVANSIKSFLEGKEEQPVDIWSLAYNILSIYEGEVKQVMIHGLKEKRFLAKMILNVKGKDIELEGRPSDTISLAIRAKKPILVSEKIMNEVSVSKNQLKSEPKRKEQD